MACFRPPVPQAALSASTLTSHHDTPKKTVAEKRARRHKRQAKWCSGYSGRETRSEKLCCQPSSLLDALNFKFVLHCCDAHLLNHPCWRQIVDICETQCGTDQFLKISGATVRLELPTVFLGGRWWRETEHAREVSRAASKNRPVNQSQHCHTSSCFQRSHVEDHERIFFFETALSKEAPLNRIDSSQYWPHSTRLGCDTP